MIDISIIITLHDEGRLATTALRSVTAAIEAASDKRCEILVVLDCANAETVQAVSRFAGPIERVRCEFGDPALARNFGLRLARGRFVTFLDGDDLMGRSWLSVAYDELLKRADKDVIAHPRLNYVFGATGAPLAWTYVDMETEAVDTRLLHAANLWSIASFAPRALYERFPFPANALEKGLGHEDWAFNLATVQAGVVHIAPRGTVYFIRRRDKGRLAQSTTQSILPNFEGSAS